MPDLEYSDIFVAGGFPLHTYNPRLSLQLENKLDGVKKNLCKLVIVTGPTKSGKTVLVRKKFPLQNNIWINGGDVENENDFWASINNRLDVYPSIETQKTDSYSTDITGSGSMKGSALVITAETEVSGKIGTNNVVSTTKSRSNSPIIAATDGLNRVRIPLIIDDFHYLPKDIQGKIIRALKPLIFNGLPVIIIAIPHRRYDAVKVEREMTGRFFGITIPLWSEEELRYIPEKGFNLLGATVNPKIIDKFTKESVGSPHLMQDFCRLLCEKKKIEKNGISRFIDYSDTEVSELFIEMSETIGRPIFEKLARGPRQRADRLPRKLKDDKTVDIYGLVLNAMAYLKPGLDTLEYTALRTAIRNVLSENEEPPQLHEISRVLKHMAEISAKDESSTAVIDYDESEKVLHITDPFFSFYLRWGKFT